MAGVRLSLLLCAIVLVAAGCGAAKPEAELQPGVLKVGVPADLRGGPERLVASGAVVSAAKLNNADGIGGVVRVKLLLVNTKGDPAAALRASRALIARGVRALVLPCSAPAVATLASRHGVLALVPCPNRPRKLEGKPLVYPTAARTADLAAARADYLRRHGGTGGTVVARLGFPDPGGFTDEFYERYKAEFGERPPGPRPGLGYDAIQVLAAAVDEAVSSKPSAVAGVLDDGLKVAGALGTITYPGNGVHEPSVQVSIVRVGPGRPRLLERS
jgi:ABC-type branched-subunit amino acid transport system substrate-binding protein